MKLRFLLLVAPSLIVPSSFLTLNHFIQPILFNNKIETYFTNNTINIEANLSDKNTLADELFDSEIIAYAKPYYNNPNELPGYDENNFKVIIMETNNLLGTVLFKAFPEKYLLDGKEMINSLSNPDYFQIMQISGLQKVIPTNFLSNINLDVVNILNEGDKMFPENLTTKQLKNILFKDNKIKLLLTPTTSEVINLPPNFSSYNIIIEETSIINDNKEGTKKFSIKINNYFNEKGAWIEPNNESSNLIESGEITLTNFGKDLLGNGQIINSDSNTIFNISEMINVDNFSYENNDFNKMLPSEVNEKSINDILKNNLKISTAFNNNSYNYKISNYDNFEGNLKVELWVEKYIEKGIIINSKKIINTTLIGFGRDLYGEGSITLSTRNTKFVSGKEILLKNFDKTLPSDVKIEDLKQALSSKEIIVDSLDDYEINIINKNDSSGTIEIEIFVNRYVEKGKLINEKLSQSIKLIGFNAYSTQNKINTIIYASVGTVAGILIISIVAFIVYKKRNKKILQTYDKNLQQNIHNIDMLSNNSKQLENKQKTLFDKTYEEYYDANKINFEMDDIFNDITVEMDDDQEDTIDRLMNEMDDDF
ncbi:MAG: lipoprotein 17-related variable surface protein [Metamycoplasmataceae bacterium]